MASPNGIDDRGRVVGAYDGDDGTVHGFVLRQGRTRTVDVPGAATGPGKGTSILRINSRGQLLGVYDDANDSCHSFLLDEGEVTLVEVRDRPTQALGFNDRDQIVGTYVDTDQVQRGFLLDDGELTTIEIPGAVTAGPSDINNRGEIAGGYSLPDGTVHAFLRDRDGDITTFDAPDDAPVVLPFGINDHGDTVGFYVDADGVTHGFRRSARGTFTTIDVPGAGDITQAHDIDDRGRIVGFAGTSRPAPPVTDAPAPATSMTETWAAEATGADRS